MRHAECCAQFLGTCRQSCKAIITHDVCDICSFHLWFSLDQFDIKLHLFSAILIRKWAPHLKDNNLPRSSRSDDRRDFIRIGHSYSVDRHNHIANLQSSALRRTSRSDARDHCAICVVMFDDAAINWITHLRRQNRIDWLDSNARKTLCDFAGCDQLPDDEFDDVHRNRKTNSAELPLPQRASAARCDCCVHANHAPINIREWSARISRIDRRIDLDEIFIIHF